MHATQQLCSSRAALFETNCVLFDIVYIFGLMISSCLDGLGIILQTWITRGVTTHNIYEFRLCFYCFCVGCAF